VATIGDDYAAGSKPNVYLLPLVFGCRTVPRLVTGRETVVERAYRIAGPPIGDCAHPGIWTLVSMEIEMDNGIGYAGFVEIESDIGLTAEAEDDAAIPALLNSTDENDGDMDEDPSFCEAFYRGFYSDLRDMTAAQAAAHWRRLGKREGRYSNAAEVITHFASQGHHLPADFDAGMYRLLNPEVHAHLRNDITASAHYIAIGRSEGLLYKPADPAFVQDLYHDERSSYSIALMAAVRRDEAPFDPTLAALFARVGLASTGFLALFDVSDYICLHAGLGLNNRAQCLHHFAEHGIAGLTPIALDHVFDPDFYRQTNREIADLADEDAYRHWLTTGLARQEQPNSAQFLKRIGLHETSVYPPAFNPHIYAAANPDLLAHLDGDWRLLQHCVFNGIAEGRPGCQLSRETIDMMRAAADHQALGGHLDTAKRLYQDILGIDPGHTITLRHWADCLYRLGDWFDAARAYEQTIHADGATIWSYLNLATCHLNLRRWRDAANTIQHIQERQRGDLGIHNRLRDICRAGFEAMRNEALWLAEQGFDAEALARMRDAVALVARPVRMASATIARSRKEIRSIAIIADLGLPQCRFYRVDQKLAQLARLGIEATLFDFRETLAEFHQRLPSVQAVIFYRVPATPEIVDAIDAVRQAEIPSFYEIDDLMFDGAHFPDSFESYGGQIERSLYATLVTGTEALKAAMALCDYGLASTRPLADRMAPLMRGGQAFVHPNALHAPHEKAMATPRPHRADERISIFYGTGTKAHNEDFEQHLAPALAQILAEFPKVQLVILGYLTLPTGLAPFTDRITVAEPVWNIGAYWRLLARMDINLAVLKPGPVADCKSEIKWLEAAMLAIPSIVTATETHRDVLADNETALFASSAEEWHAALRRLVLSEAERQRIGAAARRHAASAYAMRAATSNLRGIFESVTDAPANTGPRRRVLLVNVFFPPQAVGGATRVVADNVLDLRRLYGDQLEIEVFTGIEGSVQPYRLTSHVWQGIRVTGVTTPDDPNIDQCLFDERMGTAFATCLDRFRPDIVHFHCIQRLTLAVCEVARAGNIPYFVTIHDGWWISDRQFLVDSCGALDLYDYGNPTAELARHGVERFNRMAQLEEVLAGAAQVMTVSRDFAELHERCGLRNIRVVENGLPSLAFGSRSPSPHGKVRIAHIGGVSLHKGFNLFKAAVMLSSFENLDILIVDHALQPGIEQRSSWGATAVRSRGKAPQAEMAALYRDIDVLVAPSVWPESYGLVVREALKAGCWVVTSDRGALSQDLDAGCGHVVSVDSYHGLQEVLARINANPARYLGPTESRPLLRTAADQAAELGRLYLEAGASPEPPALPVQPSAKPRRRAPSNLARLDRPSMGQPAPL
jgi:glycosyltransferase involved in cell wall biosynthesis/tetratricopeptide (TPR) repeat protein